MIPAEVTLPDWPYDSLNLILFAEAAAAFEDLTLSGGLPQLKAQVADAWPNLFRQARFLGGGFRAGRPDAPQGGAGDGAYLLAGRPAAAGAVAAAVDEMLTPSNSTGHPPLSAARWASWKCRKHASGLKRPTRRMSAAEILAAAPRAAKCSDDARTTVRGGHGGPRRHRAGARCSR